MYCNKHKSMKETGRVSFDSLPDDVLFEVFIHVSGHDLTSSCVCVCKRWSKLIQLQRLWKQKCYTDHGYTSKMLPLMMASNKDDLRRLYFRNPYNRNLVNNPEALEGFKHWDMKANECFRVETKQVGLHRDPLLANYAGGTIQCWIPTYRNHSKHQMIDLIQRGCTSQILDIVRPDIIITDWFTGHYNLTVKMLHTPQDREPLYQYAFSSRKPLAGRLNCVRHTITDYEPGIRYIMFKHGGRQFVQQSSYDDHCTKMTLSSVQFDLSNVSGTWNCNTLWEEKCS